MTTLTRASQEWFSRPADERFDSIEALHAFCASERKLAAGATIDNRDLHASVGPDGALLLNGKTSRAKLTNWSFGQLATRAEAPAGYLRSLPSELAATCINHGLAKSENNKARLLIKRSAFDLPAGATENNILTPDQQLAGLPTIRAITSDRYDRIWNSDITQRLLDLKHSGSGWNEAPAAFDGSRGQYASDRDMFSFFVDNNRRIFETAKDGGLSRGFYCWNSETGSSVFGIDTFLYKYICGNHMVWGASNVVALRVRHVGDAASRAFGQLKGRLISYANASASEDEAKITRAMDYQLGNDKQAVLDAIFAMGKNGLPQKTADRAFQIASEHEDWYGNPRSAWGFANGVTQIARDIPNTNDRVELEKVARRIVELAF